MTAKLAGGLAPRTVHYIRAVLRSALSQALRKGLVQPRNLNRSFRSLLIRARVRVEVAEDDEGRKTFTPTVRPHDLRHSCRSFLMASGASPGVVMGVLGTPASRSR